jgi:tetratricopeptide (TPR) repeat protein
MKHCLLFLILLNNLLCNAASLTEKADALYAQNQFDQAAIEYQSIIKRGYQHSDVFYNLGNCYYRLNQIGPAILNFEKAVKYNPNHEDAIYNLKIANLKVKSKLAPMVDFVLVKWWKSVVQLFHFNTWGVINTLCFWIAILGIILFVFTEKIGLKKLSFYTALCFGILSMLTMILGYANKSIVQSDDYYIIMTPSTTVSSEPTTTGKTLYTLYEGMKVTKMDEVGKYVQIKMKDGNKGWLLKSELEGI